MVNGAADLGAFQFDLSFDKNILQYVSLTGGTLIADTGRVMTPVGPNVGVGVVTYGQISSDGGKPGANGGPYKLATIRFRGIAVGTSPLDLSKVILTSTKGFEQDKTVTNGKATIVPLPTATVRLVTQAACVRNQFDCRGLGRQSVEPGRVSVQAGVQPGLDGGAERRLMAAS